MTVNTRKRGKPFQPGNNLGKGRPAGSRNKATLALEEMLEGEAEAITRKAIELAKNGDQAAMRLVVERLIPPCRERKVRLTLPEIASAADVCNAFKAVLAQVAEGHLAIGEGERLANLLEFGRKSIEAQEYERRLAELENAVREFREFRVSYERRAA